MPGLGSTAYQTARSITLWVRALLNDSGTLSVPITIVSISRNALTGVVTVQTQLPHNLVAGDFAVIAGVPTGTSNFNGTFQVVTSTPSQMTFTYTQAGVADTQASGQVQGIGTGAIYTDSVLMPYLNLALNKLNRKMQNISNPTYIKDNVFLVVPAVASPDPSVQVVINDATPPYNGQNNQLPTDLLMPLKIWERPEGSSDDFFLMTNLTDGGGLPPQPQGQTLEAWEWRTDGLAFIGATQDTQIRLRYVYVQPDVTDGTSVLGGRDIRMPVALWTAAAAGKSRGSPLADGYQAEGDDLMEELLNTATRQMQHRNYRGKSFARRKGYTPF